ncbi:hypothetical protein [Histidinibacterium aquaticum]|uniref:Uncharacterized protein n=1 Tax=Histidinibacterium aquaticum TaxID=2613962 RepID=A0A5J5GQD3_9RHOB|nr:hypothetical protein [Histidinibacterium aquaticum]KAA9010606.1 hypothetical protein F3S47_05035 [Histidinibacterium aquaticum]
MTDATAPSSSSAVLRRIVPAVLGLLSLAALAAGIALQVLGGGVSEARTAAYVAGPPRAVTLDRFDPERHASPLGEVLLTAQLDLEAARTLAPVGGEGPAAFALPLEGLGDGRTRRALAIFTGPGFEDGRITAAGLAAIAERSGGSGPVLTLNGWLQAPGEWSAPLARAGLDPRLPVVFPFVEGRRAAFSAPEDGKSVLDLFCLVAAGLGLAALAMVAVTRPRKSTEPASAEDMAEREENAPMGRRVPALAGLSVAVVVAGGAMLVWMGQPEIEAGTSGKIVSAIVGGSEDAGLSLLQTRDWLQLKWRQAMAGHAGAAAGFVALFALMLLAWARLSYQARVDQARQRAEEQASADRSGTPA